MPAASTGWVRRYGVRGLVFAQAAAVLAGLGFLATYRHAGNTPPVAAPVQVAQAETPRNEFEFDPGEINLIRDDGHGLRAITLAQDDRPYALDRGFDMFNEIEALAE